MSMLWTGSIGSLETIGPPMDGNAWQRVLLPARTVCGRPRRGKETRAEKAARLDNLRVFYGSFMVSVLRA